MVAVVQSVSAGDTLVGQKSVTLLGTVAGNAIAVFAAMKDFSNSLTFVTPAGFTSLASKKMNSNAGLAQFWLKTGIAGGDVTIEIDVSGLTPVDMLTIIAWETTPVTFDQLASVANGGTSLDAGNLTPGTANGIALFGGALIQAGGVPTFTPGTGFTLDQTVQVDYLSAQGGAGGESKVYASAAAIDGKITWDNAASEGAGIFITLSAVLPTVATPTFNPPAGTFSTGQSVTVSCTDSGLAGFAMYYTTDGSTPTIGSTHYTGPISIDATLTLKVLAVATGYANSAVGSAAYVFVAAAPTFSPDAGVYPSTKSVTISSTTPGVSIFYTLDQSVPTSGSTPYIGPITTGAHTTIRAIATKAGYTDSTLAVAGYAVGAAITFVELASDNFQRSNENPLDPTNWTVGTGLDALEIVSHKCQATTIVTSCFELYTGLPEAVNAYSEFTVGDVESGGYIGTFVRANLDSTHGYEVFVEGPLDGLTSSLQVGRLSDSVAIFDLESQAAAQGDLVRLAVIGSTWYVYQNGRLLGSGIDTDTLGAGLTGAQVQPVSDITLTDITGFAAGSATVPVGRSSRSK